MMRFFLFYFLLFGPLCSASASISSLYNRLDPQSVRQHFAFYELYPDTKEGKNALKDGWKLLNQEKHNTISIPQIDIDAFMALIQGSSHSLPILQEKDLILLEKLGKHLGNRKLTTYNKWDLQTILQQTPQEVDIGRALLLAAWGEDQNHRIKIRSYEAMMDLMALQIQARLDLNPSALDKINAINYFLFFELGFRFPPYSLYSKNVDLFSFLPSVIDSRKGVCLGISVLYLCLAQRLDLILEPITPPGHIFVRYTSPEGKVRNIETTARGIHIDTKDYLSMETCSLPIRNYTEVIGLVFMNIASNAWMRKAYDEAISYYEKALLYLPNDPLAQKFLAYNHLFAGNIKKGKALLHAIVDIEPKDSVSKDSIPEDFLNNKVNVQAIKTIYMQTDESRDSIIKKQKKLHAILKKYPKFRGGLFHIALSYLQIGREKEALQYLEDYWKIDAHEPSVNYYLTLLHLNRYNYPKAWDHFLLLQDRLHKKNYYPHKLQQLQLSLKKLSPPPSSQDPR